MNELLKAYLVKEFKLAEDADEATAKAMVSEKLKSGDLDPDKYTELLAVKADKGARGELADMLKENSKETATAVSSALSPALTAIADSLKERTAPPPKAPPVGDDDDDDGTPADMQKQLADMEERLAKKLGLNKPGTDGATLMNLALEVEGEKAKDIKVKHLVDSLSHTPTALTYKSVQAKQLNLLDQPMEYNGKEVNKPTEKSRMMSAVWMKFQLFPEMLKDWEHDVVRWILHKEKFLVPNADNRTDAVFLTEQQRQGVYEFNKRFYERGYQKAVIDDSSSGGENAIPEFFDMDMILTPTLAAENIPSFVNMVPVPRGTAAQNFILGRPTIAAANTEGSAVALFSTSGFITNHDTSFFRAAGFIEIGRNFAEDAHPRLVTEIQAQYMNSVRLWFNEQIMAGDGSTEPQGVTVASGTTDVTPANPTTGALTLNDVFDLLFGVGKAHREDGGRQNAIYVMTDTTYQRIRRIATGVTGDTRLVFGEDVESYRLFGHPVLIEENGLSNQDIVFMQAKGYRLYNRQGPRFIREDRGDTLVRQNSFIVGVDIRAGGQLDLGAYAALVDSAPV